MNSEASTPERSSSGILRTRKRRAPRGSFSSSHENPGLKPPSRVDPPSPSSPSQGASPNLAPHVSSRGLSPGSQAQRSSNDTRYKATSSPSRPFNHDSTFSTGLWGPSWSALRDTASTIWNGEYLRPPDAYTSPRRRQGAPSLVNGRREEPREWGPPPQKDVQIGCGTVEDRVVQVQAKKREVLLSATTKLDDGSSIDKRRNSNECHASSAPPGDSDDRDALVYLHQVRPNDTMAGVMIKYACPQNVFRKANRLWPNDRIQIRKTVVLPVDACGVRGRKLPQSQRHQHQADLLDSECDDLEQTPTIHHAPWSLTEASRSPKAAAFSSISTSPSISVSLADTSTSATEPWKHDSWVQIEGFPSPVEIARLSRRNLGYFPPSRRKSNSFSDLDSPSASLDLGPSTDRPRTTKLLERRAPREQSRSSSSSYFVDRLQGPGGVGTLGKEVHGPGPAQDGLNKLFAAHLPDVAPKISLESLSSQPIQGVALDNIGGAVEGWVRKLASRASRGVHHGSNGSAGRDWGDGDLIEMDDTSDFGDAGSDNGRLGVQVRESDAKVEGPTGWHHGAEELRDRFPPRGRVFEDASKH